MLVGFGSQSGALEFAEELLGGVVCEANIGGEKLLVEDRGAEKARELLLFNGIARQRQHVADASEDEAGDAAFERAEKGDLAVLEREDRVALAKFNAVLAGYGVHVLGIELQRVKSGEDFPWGRVRCAAQRGQTGKDKQTRRNLMERV